MESRQDSGGIGPGAWAHAPVFTGHLLFLGAVLGKGRPGLIGFGLYLVVTSLAVPLVVRWGERTRPATPEAEVAPDSPNSNPPAASD